MMFLVDEIQLCRSWSSLYRSGRSKRQRPICRLRTQREGFLCTFHVNAQVKGFEREERFRQVPQKELQKVTAGMGIKAVQRDRAAQVELLPGLAYRLTTARLSEDAQLLDAVLSDGSKD